MALIDCVECKTKISDKAKSCPSCGHPVSENLLQKVFSNNRLNELGMSLFVIILLTISFYLYLLIMKDLYDEKMLKAFEEILKLPFTWPLLIFYSFICMLVIIDSHFWFIPFLFYVSYKAYILKGIIISKLLAPIYTYNPYKYGNVTDYDAIYDKAIITIDSIIIIFISILSFKVLMKNYDKSVFADSNSISSDIIEYNSNKSDNNNIKLDDAYKRAENSKISEKECMSCENRYSENFKNCPKCSCKDFSWV